MFFHARNRFSFTEKIYLPLYLKLYLYRAYLALRCENVLLSLLDSQRTHAQVSKCHRGKTRTVESARKAFYYRK